MIIKIDVRETALIAVLQKLMLASSPSSNIELKVETLPLGDIIIGNETQDFLIIERKSLTDLLSSIKDGRYEEQSYRLNGLNHHNHNIIYLIEGDVNKLNPFKSNLHIEKQTLYSAMFSILYFKGFSVFRSINMDETATIILNMANKLAKSPVNRTAFYSVKTNNSVESPEIKEEMDEEPTVPCEKDYVNVIKKNKKENITTGNIGEIMLCQIPGISSITAIAILEKYKTIGNLIKELTLNNECLNGISYTNSKGQVRKINKTCLQNIAKFLLEGS